MLEFDCIKVGGVANGMRGTGLFPHYKSAQSLLWPEDDHHRWSDLILQTVCDNDVSVLAGSSDSGKTYGMCKFGLVHWFCQPYNTLVLVSSTDVRGLEMRIWGKIKELFNYAKERYDWLPGYVLESVHAITPDTIDDRNERGRTFTKGFICVPCIQGSQYVGMGKFVGVKPASTPGLNDGRLCHLGDEVSVMRRSFLDAYSNWYGKPNFKGVMSGNFFGVDDPLGVAAEPIEGWTGMPTPTKTTTWRSRWFNAAVVNLVGSDSPNFEFPQDQPSRFPYLIGRKKLEAVAKTYGKDSFEYSSQCEGVMRPGLAGKLVITRELCRQHGAHDKAVWLNTSQTKIYACDPAYGGGDRCVGIIVEFGEGVNGNQILKFHDPEIIPVSTKLNTVPEDQIAQYIKDRLEDEGIPVENCFYDSTGKGTLGFAFARVFGYVTPTPIDSGAKPTKRPVRYDLYVDNRLKRCDEHYSKFVTEMWFSVREAIESDQVRELPMDVMQEGCMREYAIVAGSKFEVKPKDELREKFGKSPDLFDAAALSVEGARRRGFHIQRLAEESEEGTDETWWDAEARDFDETIKGKLLQHV